MDPQFNGSLDRYLTSQLDDDQSDGPYICQHGRAFCKRCIEPDGSEDLFEDDDQ